MQRTEQRTEQNIVIIFNGGSRTNNLGGWSLEGRLHSPGRQLLGRESYLRVSVFLYRAVSGYVVYVW